MTPVGKDVQLMLRQFHSRALNTHSTSTGTRLPSIEPNSSQTLTCTLSKGSTSTATPLPFENSLANPSGVSQLVDSSLNTLPALGEEPSKKPHIPPLNGSNYLTGNTPNKYKPMDILRASPQGDLRSSKMSLHQIRTRGLDKTKQSNLAKKVAGATQLMDTSVH